MISYVAQRSQFDFSLSFSGDGSSVVHKKFPLNPWQPSKQLLEPLNYMDIKLCGKVDGIDAAARIRSQMNIPSVFLTGHGEKELVAWAVEACPLGYTIKPLIESQQSISKPKHIDSI
jgi:CheY-like chemotaxis protein